MVTGTVNDGDNAGKYTNDDVTIAPIINIYQYLGNFVYYEIDNSDHKTMTMMKSAIIIKIVANNNSKNNTN